MPRHALDGGSIEQIGRIAPTATQPVLGLVHRQGEIKLRAVGCQRQAAGLNAVQRDIGPRRILQHQHDLEQRIAAHVAGGREFLDQLLERQVLMRVGAQRRFPHASEQLGEARVAGQIRAQHQRVDEESDQAFQLRVAASGNGRAHGNVVLTAVAIQQHLEGGQQRHEQRCAFAPSQLFERLVSGAGRSKARRAPLMAGHRRARPVGGQFQRRQIGEFLFPVAELVAPTPRPVNQSRCHTA